MEIVPYENASPEFHLTAVTRRYFNIAQPPFNASMRFIEGKQVQRFFGYNVDRSELRTDYLGSKVDLNQYEGNAKEIRNDTFTGLWFKWQNRNESSGDGPGLQVTSMSFLPVDSQNFLFTLDA